jgi:hypothetical protein
VFAKLQLFLKTAKLFFDFWHILKKLYYKFADLKKQQKMNLQILENIRTLKRRLIPNEKLILFGSQARGDARSDSD